MPTLQEEIKKVDRAIKEGRLQIRHLKEGEDFRYEKNNKKAAEAKEAKGRQTVLSHAKGNESS
jgi:hypothetical protein